jgi:3'-phosphoadenosine 5'-phosphosulfate sulfotransferase (PAPS reductase)/FAD synthetase
MTSPYTLPEGNVQIAFSGGRTSAYMLHQILEANGDLPDRVQVCFQNTGREMPETLEFVQEVSERWAVPVIWLEYQREDPGFSIVNHNSASRDGEPFEALIRKKKYLPNAVARFCTIELKVRTAKQYLMSLGWDRWKNATGIRADEARRVKQSRDPLWSNWHPLVDAGVSNRDVKAFWDAQPFDLALENINGKTPLGNCDGCFLKSEAAQAALFRDYPDRHAWWEDMEHLASQLTSNRNGAKFVTEYSRKDLRTFVERQGDWIFDAEDALCQVDGGECTG